MAFLLTEEGEGIRLEAEVEGKVVVVYKDQNPGAYERLEALQLKKDADGLPLHFRVYPGDDAPENPEPQTPYTFVDAEISKKYSPSRECIIGINAESIHKATNYLARYKADARTLRPSVVNYNPLQHRWLGSSNSGTVLIPAEIL